MIKTYATWQFSAWHFLAIVGIAAEQERYPWGAGSVKGKRKASRKKLERRKLVVYEEQRAEQELSSENTQHPVAPKRARIAGKSSRGIQLKPEQDKEPLRNAEVVKQDTATIIAQQGAGQHATLAEALAILQAAAVREADNEALALLLMAEQSAPGAQSEICVPGFHVEMLLLLMVADEIQERKEMRGIRLLPGWDMPLHRAEADNELLMLPLMAA